MVKYELRENGFSEVERINKKGVITILWAIFTAAFIFGAVIFMLVNIGWIQWGKDGSPIAPAVAFDLELETLFMTLVKLFGTVFLYLAIKFILNILFCFDKYKSIKFGFLVHNNFPVIHCKEAFKIWQVIVMYLIPVVIGYGYMLGTIAYQYYVTGTMSSDLITLVVLAFFIALDLTLVVYISYIKLKDKDLDYISVDHHIYSVTLFKGTYVKAVNNKAARKRIKEFYSRKNYKSQKKAFEKMITCGNLECENYGNKLDETEATCPLCGAKTGNFAMTYTGMTTCLNPECDNYGYELRDDPEKCLLCGGKTGQFAFKIKKHLTKPAIIIALSSIVVFGVVSWLMCNAEVMGVPNMVIGFAKLVISAVSIGLGISSKSKAAILITITAFILNPVINSVIYMIAG